MICLMSGGGSALLTAPAAGLTLADKQRLNQALLDSGAGIGDMNCVRKHLSQIKGGRFGFGLRAGSVGDAGHQRCTGADDVGVIASGPTVPDRTTCADAVAILERLNIDLPAPVLGGAAGRQLGSHPSRTSPVWATHSGELIATPRDALQAAASVVNAAGLPAYILSDDLEGESREVGRVHAAFGNGCCDRRWSHQAARLFGVQSAVRYFERWGDHGHHQKASARARSWPRDAVGGR